MTPMNLLEPPELRQTRSQSAEPDPGATQSTPIEAQEGLARGARQRASEVAAVLVGQQTDQGWSGSLTQLQEGAVASAQFDWAWALAREESRGDVIGFYHTHPGGAAVPSQRDLRTMRVWVTCFGKPLLCLVEGDCDLAAYIFETDEDDGQRLPETWRHGDRFEART